MARSIHEFLESEMDKPFTWDETSCAAMSDRRVEEITGKSPLKEFGREIGGEQTAKEWMSAPGGLIRAVRSVMAKSGFRRTCEPTENDVGLVISGNKVCVALFDGVMWRSRDEDGFIGAQKEAVVMSWRIE